MLEELARRDPAGTGELRHEPGDPGVRIHEAAGRIDGRRAGGHLGDGAVAVEKDDARADELAGRVVRREDLTA